MDIKTFNIVAPNLPPEIAILMRGPTGVGKSHLGKAVAKKKQLPFIDVRLSTMSEGDVGGYPDIEGMKETGIMTMCMPSWFIRACREPVVLMLDEMNRALPGVQQAAFQLILDRELGNDKDGRPYRLHPETRIIAAVNRGAEYDVNDMDPALLRRFWVCDLQPTSDDWMTWAQESGIDAVLVDFIRQHPEHLRVDPSEVEPGTVCPNPASWQRVNDSLVAMQMAPAQVAGKKRPEGFYAVAQGMVGNEAAIAFTDFVEGYELVLSAEDILDSYSEKRAVVKGLGNDRVNALIEKLKNHCTANKWTQEQAKNVAAFAKDMPGEMMVSLWNGISATQQMQNIQKMHKLIGADVVKAVQASRNL